MPGEAAEAQDRTIVVGVDGSPLSLGALKWAARLAPSLGARIAAVTAWHFPLDTGSGSYPPLDWDPETDAERILEQALRDAFGEMLPAGLEARTVMGQPARVLIDESRSALMLIVGSRGHGGFAGLLLGSVSSACAEHATCPVLVVHEPGEAESTGTAGTSP